MIDLNKYTFEEEIEFVWKIINILYETYDNLNEQEKESFMKVYKRSHKFLDNDLSY